MRRTAPLCMLALGCLLALGACTDEPTSLAPSDPEFNRGQTKKGASDPPPVGDIVRLGKQIFEDANLSVNRNQSCQTCHEPSEGFAAPLKSVLTRGSVVQGSVAGRFGDRKPPSAAYATLAPLFSGGNNPVGGNFWDGRATGEVLGNPAADQALGPFLNPVEQGLPDKACVAYRIARSGYVNEFTSVFGGGLTSIGFPGNTETICGDASLAVGEHVVLSASDRRTVEAVYNDVALAIAAFEGSVNRFSSRFDRGEMSALEQQGQKLFGSKGKCQQCHENRGSQPVFTDFQYHNLGVPKNPANPVYHLNTGAFDPGLGGFTGQARHLGKFRTPTTRNVAMGENRTYMHNGALINLTQVVDFYNTRDVLRECTPAETAAGPASWGSVEFGGVGCWPPPEYPGNLDTKNMGKLGLTKAEVEAIVVYLEAMTDL